MPLFVISNIGIGILPCSSLSHSGVGYIDIYNKAKFYIGLYTVHSNELQKQNHLIVTISMRLCL